MISDTAFTQWLKDGASNIRVLAEMKFAYEPRLNYIAVPTGTAYTTIPAQMPDSPSNSVTGDFTIDWFGSIGTYTSNANGAQGLLEKWDSAVANRCFQFILLNGGTPRVGWDPLGTGAGAGVNAVQALPSTVALGTVAPAGTIVGVRAEAVMNNGAGACEARYYYSFDFGGTWTPLGAVVTGSTTSSGVFDGTIAITVNGINSSAAPFQYQLGANIYRVKLYSGVGAARSLRQDLNPSVLTVGGAVPIIPDSVTGSWAIGADHLVVVGSSGAPAEGLIYLSDKGYVAKPSDPSPNQRYRAVIMNAPTFERSIDIQQLGGHGSSSTGDVTLANADGSLDFMLEAILDGRDVAYYIGDKDWARADFRLVNVASEVSVKATSDQNLSVQLRDKNFLLDAAMFGATIATGPNAGKMRPTLMGYVWNFDLQPYLLDITGPTYYFNSFPMDVFGNLGITVRDNGVSLTGGNAVNASSGTTTADTVTDTITLTSHGLNNNDVCYWLAGTFFAGLNVSTQYWVVNATANTWQFSLTRGGAPVDITGNTFSGTISIIRKRYYIDSSNALVTLSSSPAGRVTMDIFAIGPSGDANLLYLPHAAFRWILDRFTSVDATLRDTTAFSNLVSAENSANILWGRAILDRTNVMDVLDSIAVITNSWYAWRADGLLTVGKLDLQHLDAATPIDTITQSDIEGDPSCENRVIQFGKILYDATPNVAVQSDGLAGSVSTTDRAKWGQQFQKRTKTTDPAGTDYPNEWWAYHKTAIDSPPLGTYQADATSNYQFMQVQCDERTELFRPWTRVFSCTVGLDKYARNPGDCVLVKYPRYGLSAGVNFRVLSVKPRLSDRAVDLVLVRRTIPNSVTSSYG